MVRLLLTTTVLLWLLQHLLDNIPPAEFTVYAVVQSLLLFVPLLFVASLSSSESAQTFNERKKS